MKFSLFLTTSLKKFKDVVFNIKLELSLQFETESNILRTVFPEHFVLINCVHYPRVDDDIGVTSLAPSAQIRSREAAHPNSGSRQVFESYLKIYEI